MSNVVLFNELLTNGNNKIGIATLNSERSLNALNLEMVSLLTTKLLEWQTDPNIVMVILEGAGEKAFCAGGDVVKLYRASTSASLLSNKSSNEDNYSKDVETFFTKEYQLDHLIHTYQKPILLWGNGIVMGGGLGLFAGASHRIVTESSKIAMPEITIGLYPDAGGTYFLSRMPSGCGLFLGLTGSTINATDAKYVNLADHFINSANKDKLIEELLLIDWDKGVNSYVDKHKRNNCKKLSAILESFEMQDRKLMPMGNIEQYQSLMEKLENSQTVDEAVTEILNTPSINTWFDKAKSSLQKGSALSAHIIQRQLFIGKDLPLEGCFRLELGLSVQCVTIGDFKEGVRALLVDKDRKPKWQFNKIAQVDEQVVNNLFASPWPEEQQPLLKLNI